MEVDSHISVESLKVIAEVLNRGGTPPQGGAHKFLGGREP